MNKDLNCDYLIIGAGYTGLSAARKLSEVNSNKNIIIVDNVVDIIKATAKIFKNLVFLQIVYAGRCFNLEF